MIETLSPTLARCQRELNLLRPHVPVENFPVLEKRLELSPDPKTALRYMERLHGSHPEAFRRMAGERALLNYMVQLFGHSRFLAETVVAHPDWLESLLHSEELERVLTMDEMSEKLGAFLFGRGEEEPSALSLSLFRRQQLLRIVLRDILELASLSELTLEVSHLADAILDVVYQRLRRGLIARYGTPRCGDAEGQQRECGFVVMALGKLGGVELNYSSDIDLMFLFDDNGYTDGERSISNKEFFIKLANQMTRVLSAHTAEGFCYRVDLRLRPDGSMGELCISLNAAIDYYRTRGRDWELQMLIKARAAAGEKILGVKLLTLVEPLIYHSTLDFRAVEAVSEARLRRSEKLAQNGATAGINVKLAEGGIRDIEFLVQCLQRLYGGRKARVRHGGTLPALSRLRDKAFLSDSDYTRLVTAYSFLRHLEHRLQFWEDQQTHTLTSDPDELETWARRMPPSQMDNEATAAQLQRKLQAHLTEVREIYDRVIHSQRPMYYQNLPAPAAVAAEESQGNQSLDELRSNQLAGVLEEKAPNLKDVALRGTLSRGWKQFENFVEEIAGLPECLELLDQNERLAANIVDLFEHSPYFAEQIIRHPDLIFSLEDLSEATDLAGRYRSEALLLPSTSELRAYWRREMLRIQVRSVCQCSPIFETLKETSRLADAMIAAAYRLAVEHVAQSAQDGEKRPSDALMVIALGRLGMLEFDLSSDADLVFLIPDEESQHLHFWTKVAERLIQILTAYSGDGVMFAIDTRLRPNGGDGPLVQTAASYLDYFNSTAQAWEGITYMKSRAIAGNLTAATKFLSQLQEIDWRRYGQSGTSAKQLRQMRMRIEKEAGSGNLLKSGRGGYYDVDFALMFLRLKSAGIFFDVLNTPERIDIIEKMGHLLRPDAQFLRDAATFYRSLDHAMRVYSGHSEGQLPKTEAHLRAVSELVSRWTPEHLHDQALDIELRQIQDRTRQFFERLFV